MSGARFDLLYDRPFSPQPGLAEVFHRRILRDVGERFLGRFIRPALIIRKNSYGNRSQRGADCQAALTSVFQTLKQRGHNPVTTICKAIATYLKTGQLPRLPANIVPNG